MSQINTDPWFDEGLLVANLQEKNSKSFEALDQQRSKFSNFYANLKDSFNKTNELLEIIETNQKQ